MATSPNPIEDAPDEHSNGALNAQDCTPLMFLEIELEDVRDGMVLRFQPLDAANGWGHPPQTGVSVVRREHFSPLDEDLVIDAEDLPCTRVSEIYRSYRVSALTPAIY